MTQYVTGLACIGRDYGNQDNRTRSNSEQACIQHHNLHREAAVIGTPVQNFCNLKALPRSSLPDVETEFEIPMTSVIWDLVKLSVTKSGTEDCWTSVTA